MWTIVPEGWFGERPLSHGKRLREPETTENFSRQMDKRFVGRRATSQVWQAAAGREGVLRPAAALERRPPLLPIMIPLPTSPASFQSAKNLLVTVQAHSCSPLAADAWDTTPSGCWHRSAGIATQLPHLVERQPLVEQVRATNAGSAAAALPARMCHQWKELYHGNIRQATSTCWAPPASGERRALVHILEDWH